MANKILEVKELYDSLMVLVSNFAKKKEKTVYIKKIVLDFDKTYITYASVNDTKLESAPDEVYESDSTITFINRYNK